MAEITIDMNNVKMSEALQVLDHAVTDTLHFFNELDFSNLTRTLQAFGQLKDAKNKLDSLQETISKLYEHLDKEKIPDVLNTLEIPRIEVGGKLFSVAARLNASIPEYKRDAGHRWVIEELRMPELILPRVNSKSLSSAVKTYFESNGKLPPEEAVTVHLQQYVQVRKA
jgi:hypothetical protein